jgi:hypothetical protein
MTAEWLSLADAARLCGLSEKHMRRIVMEAKRGIRTFWKERRVIWQEAPQGFQIALSALPQDAREQHLVETYHLNLALPEPLRRSGLSGV